MSTRFYDPTDRSAAYLSQINTRRRIERWSAKNYSKVTHPIYGTVVVPAGSPFIAIKHAAEVWGVNWTELEGATTTIPDPKEIPVTMPPMKSRRK